MKTSIVILTYNQLEYTKKCLESIRKFTTPGSYEIIIVDNGSTDGTVEWLQRQKKIRTLFNKENLGFPAGCNQGIELTCGDNVLLLNNDVIVTYNWLKNLLLALYSTENIGAVGAVTNNCSYGQAIKVTYKSTEAMHLFAKSHNVSNPALWDERLKLIGFCFLIRKVVINKIGLLDEIFSPGNFEDDDYSLRIRRAGYKLLLCRDTFIHHFGGASFLKDTAAYNRLLQHNARKFESKWGYNPNYSMFVRQEIIEMMNTSSDKPFRVLEIGCACGGTLLQIKNRYPKAELFGIELNSNAAESAKSFADVMAVNIEDTELPYPKRYFHYIILADILEHLQNPWSALLKLYPLLAPGGKILASIPNVMHISVLRNLLNGHWNYEDAGILDKTHLRFFTLNEIQKMFASANFTDLKYATTNVQCSEAESKLMDSLADLTNSTMKSQYSAYQYLVSADKGYIAEDLSDILLEIEQEKNMDENISYLSYFPLSSIIEQIMMGVVSGKVKLLNLIATANYSAGLFDYVIPYLKSALECDPKDSNTLYNLGWVLYIMGEYDRALTYAEKIEEKTEADKGLIKKISAAQANHAFQHTLAINLVTSKQNWVTLFPETENVHLIKDVGMIPFVMHKHYDYNSIIVCYRNGKYPHLERSVQGLKIDFLDHYNKDAEADGCEYLKNHARNIHVLHLFHLEPRTLRWISLYKSLNPTGKVYLKLDANINSLHINLDKSVILILQLCDLISVETKYLYEKLNAQWPVDIQYIPNGFYDFADQSPVTWEEKENVICTVGRIGLPVKANEVLLDAFKAAAPTIPEWKLKLIGPIEPSFKLYIESYFIDNPALVDRVFFTGEITDRILLDKEYRRSKIFCLTSIIESFGIVFVEAIKNGCLVISSNVISAPDIIAEGSYGDIFDVGDAGQLAQYLIANCHNPSRLQSVCNTVPTFAYKHFYWVDIGAQIKNCLASANRSEVQEIAAIIQKECEDSLTLLNQSERTAVCNQVFVDRLNQYPIAYKLAFWQYHAELKALEQYPEIAGNLLDFGCGSGHLDVFLARQGQCVHGVDLSPLGIAIATHLREKEDPLIRSRLSFEVVDITQNRQNKNQLYDAVWSTHVFEHIGDPAPIFAGLQQWVKPRAFMLISISLGHAYDDPGHIHHFSSETDFTSYLASYIQVVRVEKNIADQTLRALCRFD